MPIGPSKGSQAASAAGSWAGPAWFKMLLGLGGNQGGGGGGDRGNFMYLYHNFSFSRQKRMVKAIRSYQFSDTRLLAAMKLVKFLTDD